MNKVILGLLLGLLLQPAWGQVNRYMVFLTDKDGSPFSVDQPEAFLSPRALERRQQHGFEVAQEDLPVDPGYVEQVAGTGVEVYYRSRWFNAVLIQADMSQIPLVADLEIVDRVEYVGPGAKLGARVGAPEGEQDIDGVNQTQELTTILQNQMIDVNEMHAQGYRGEGMLIAVFDAGFKGVDEVRPFKHLFDNSQIKGVFNYINSDQEVYQFNDHGTQVLSVLAAFDSLDIIGTAHKSDYFLLVTEDNGPEFRVEEYNWLLAAEFADSAGVDVINSSLGYSLFDDTTMDYSFEDLDGKTTVVARAANMAAERGILIVVSVGNDRNDDWEHITSPSDSENVLAIGAVNTLNELGSFSSVGPSFDQRIKPDLVALGVGTTTVRASGTVSLGSGTSFAAPLVAGLATGYWQANPFLTNTEVMERLRRSGDNYETPDNQRGYGLPSFLGAQEVVGFDDEIAASSNYKVYPNPVSSLLMIEVREEQQHQKLEARLYSTGGQMLIDLESVGRRSVELDLSNFSAGIYILSITSLSENRRLKVVKY